MMGIIKRVNTIDPYQFSVVDTFGSMKLRDMKRIILNADSELNQDIKLGLHLHENMSLSVSLTQAFLDFKFQRGVSIDASLMGIGRDPGNLPIELIADHINDDFGGKYKIEFLLDSIEDHTSIMYGNAAWGYNPVYFLSARHNLHRNYSEFYHKKGDLAHRDINTIFMHFSDDKKTIFDKEYAEKRYYEYKANNVDDSADRENLAGLLKGRDILILAPGTTLKTHKPDIDSYISSKKPVIVSVNFVSLDYDVDFAFFGNTRRYQMLNDNSCKIITTSNMQVDKTDYHLNYLKLIDKEDKFVNSISLFMRFLLSIGIKQVSLAGADGYHETGKNYFDEYIRSVNENFSDINEYTGNLWKNIGIELNFITPSLYS